jgi:hypothetical protein
MKSRARWIWVVFVLALVLGWYPTLAQEGMNPSDERRLYPQHGHWVEGDFLETYLSIPNPEEIYGYPITEAFQEQTHERIVQYFEKARFELVPDNPPELRVRITELGSYFFTPAGQELPLPSNFPACKHFEETGKRVCYAFLDYFEDNGGAAQFGYPLSNFEIQDELIVQYFQRARFEWHPELPPGKRVGLTNLGYRYFYKIGEDPARLLAAFTSDDNIPIPVLSLRVRAFPLSAVLPKTGSQTIFIIVQDQNLLPVANAQITLVIKLPSGAEQRVIVPTTTNESGISQYTFDFRNEPTGVAQVIVSAATEAFQKQTITSFRIWW